MAKKHYILMGIFLVLYGFGIAQHSNLRLKVKEIYTSQIGVTELTGNNDGEKVEMYLNAVGLGQGYAWCSAFVFWAYDSAGVETISKEQAAWSPAWFTNDKVIYVRGKFGNKVPIPGDVFGIYYNNKGRIAHVGFVDEWGYGKIAITVEGNTNEDGGREGNGVYRKRRLKRQIYKVANYID